MGVGMEATSEDPLRRPCSAVARVAAVAVQ